MWNSVSQCPSISTMVLQLWLWLHFLYREDNANPLLRELVEYLQSPAAPPFEFARASAFQQEGAGEH